MKLRTIMLLLLPACLWAAGLPLFYSTVTRVLWISNDLDATIAGWTKFGLTGVTEDGRPHRQHRTAQGWIGELRIDFIQPSGGNDASARFLKQHGPGILALMHRASSERALEDEVARMRGLGVGVLERDSGSVLFDTSSGGKYILGLYADPSPQPAPPAKGKITQFAFVVRAFQPVSDYWQKLGFPPLQVMRPVLHDVAYRGKPAHYDQELGWQRHGTVPYEWCVPPQGMRTVYSEYLERHGEGIQHLGVNVEDIDRFIAEKGFAVSQSGGWGEPGKKGSGRFAYLETEAIGGITVELLWNWK